MDEDSGDILQYESLENEEHSKLVFDSPNQWYWKNDSVWELYDVFLNAGIQNAFAKKKKEYTFTIPDKGTYVILLDKMLQINEHTGVSRKIKCDHFDNRDKITLQGSMHRSPPKTFLSPSTTTTTTTITPPSHHKKDDGSPKFSTSHVDSVSETKSLAKSSPLPRGSSGINQWYWDNNGTWEPYDTLTNIAIQNAFAKNEKKICAGSTHWQL